MARTKAAGSQQNLDRALELMEMLARNGGGMNISDISRALDVTRVTASSMAQSLLQRNFIEKDVSSGKFYIGYKFLDLSQAYRYRYPFLYAAEGHMRSMAEKLEVRINICVLKPPGVAVAVLSKDVSLLPKMIMGYVFPAYASASGKVLLAYAEESMTGPWIDKMEFVQYTPSTICDREKLCEELSHVREQGVGFEWGEMVPQRCCVAAPIRDISGSVIASVSFSCTKERMEQDQAVLVENICQLADTISSTLGYNTIQFT